MVDWRTLKVGDTLRWFGTEFDGSWDYPCEISEIKSDCAVALCNGMRLTVDDWSRGQFRFA